MTAEQAGPSPRAPAADSGGGARRTSRHAFIRNPFVGVLKLVLPVSALGLLATIIAWPFLGGGGAYLPEQAELEQEGVRDVRVFEAEYAGSLDNGVTYVLTADQTAQPRIDSPVVSLDGPRGKARNSAGGIYTFQAVNGRIDQRNGELTLWGDVKAVRDGAYTITTGQVTIDLKTQGGHSDMPVRIQGPGMDIAAAGFTFQDMGSRVELTGASRIRLAPAASADN